MEIKVKWGLWAAFRASALTLFQMGKGELKLASGGQSCALSGDGMAMGWLARGWANWAVVGVWGWMGWMRGRGEMGWMRQMGQMGRMWRMGWMPMGVDEGGM